uniref:Uncharacterized protein n=1 Tax=Oryza glaberrima TaxID=4538 RepID=I1PAN9_ORYGL
MGSHAGVSIAFRVMLVMVDEDVELWEALEKGDVTVEAKLDGVEYRTMELSKELVAYMWAPRITFNFFR